MPADRHSVTSEVGLPPSTISSFRGFPKRPKRPGASQSLCAAAGEGQARAPSLVTSTVCRLGCSVSTGQRQHTVTGFTSCRSCDGSVVAVSKSGNAANHHISTTPIFRTPVTFPSPFPQHFIVSSGRLSPRHLARCCATLPCCCPGAEPPVDSCIVITVFVCALFGGRYAANTFLHASSHPPRCNTMPCPCAFVLLPLPHVPLLLRGRFGPRHMSYPIVSVSPLVLSSPLLAYPLSLATTDV